jgi:hypothetical protein
MLTSIRVQEYLVDEMVDHYVEWRACAAAVAAGLSALVRGITSRDASVVFGIHRVA